MIDRLPGSACIFGEAPVWDSAAQRLYWIDCVAPALLQYDWASGKVRRLDLDLPCPVSGLVHGNAGALVVISSHGLFLVDSERQQSSRLPLRSDVALAGANDGKCDRQGRLWFGTGDGEGSRPPGQLLRVDPDLRVQVLDTGLSIPNGPAFSADGSRMFLADSAAGIIYRYALEPTTGTVGEREVFTRISAADGAPDGMTVDEADHLWVALYDGSSLLRYSAQGELEQRLSFPLTRITSCAFGGPDLALLFVTSAIREWTLEPSDADRTSEIETLFQIKSVARGIEEKPFDPLR